MSFHGSTTVNVAGSSVPLVSRTILTPTQRFCSAVTIQYTGSATIYIGEGTQATDVSETSFGVQLDSSQPSVTIGNPAGPPVVDLAGIRVDSNSLSAETVTWNAEQR